MAVLTAAMVYLALNGLLVRPIERMVSNMMRFSADPEDASRIITPSDRQDEIGTTERELAHMQRELVHALLQKNRLAQLGLAVSKINHDLRNMLANAQLISDRLGMVEDPTVQRVTPKLIKSLDRAIRLCADTLRYGQAREPAPERQQVVLRPLVQDLAEDLGLAATGPVAGDATAIRTRIAAPGSSRSGMAAGSAGRPRHPGCRTARRSGWGGWAGSGSPCPSRCSTPRAAAARD